MRKNLGIHYLSPQQNSQISDCRMLAQTKEDNKIYLQFGIFYALKMPDTLFKLSLILGQTAFLQRLKNVQEDDSFLYNVGDELVRPEILMFPKLYEGFSDPIGFKYRWTIFGFF